MPEDTTRLPTDDSDAQGPRPAPEHAHEPDVASRDERLEAPDPRPVEGEDDDGPRLTDDEGVVS